MKDLFEPVCNTTFLLNYQTLVVWIYQKNISQSRKYSSGEVWKMFPYVGLFCPGSQVTSTNTIRHDMTEICKHQWPYITKWCRY